MGMREFILVWRMNLYLIFKDHVIYRQKKRTSSTLLKNKLDALNYMLVESLFHKSVVIIPHFCNIASPIFSLRQ